MDVGLKVGYVYMFISSKGEILDVQFGGGELFGHCSPDT